MNKALCLAILGLVILTGCSQGVTGPKPTPVNNAETQAVKAARELFAEKYGSWQEATRAAALADGPCLSNEIIPDWVADIAHQPRNDDDNKPENQCDAYRNGTARHFVELDSQGNYLRAY